jgi:hypothetical protein
MVSCTVNGGTGHAPDLTSPIYLAAAENFIAQLFAQYGNDSRIAFIRIGPGAGGETFPPCKPEMQSAYGQTLASYTAYVDAILAAQRPLLGSVPAMVALDCYGACPGSNMDSFSANVAGTAAANNLGLGKESLQQADVISWNSGQACGANWCADFVANPHSFHDLQFAVPTCADGNCTVGSPITLLPFAASRGAHVVEMATADYCIAYGPCSNSYTTAYQAAIAAFNSAAAGSWTPAAPTNLRVIVAQGPYASVSPGSLAFTFTAADATNGNAAQLSGHEVLLVRNTDTSAHNFTIYSTPDALNRTGDIGPYSLAGGSTAGFSFLGGEIGWRQPDGSVHVTADDTHIEFAFLKAQL